MDERLLANEATRGEQENCVSFNTLRFGEVSVSDARIVEFPRGLVGLPQAQRFVFLHQGDAPGAFYWMQAVDDPALAFVVCEPQIFFPDYRVSLTTEQQKELGIAGPEDGLVCVILVVPQDPRQITANLRGPIVINPACQLGFQLVLAGEEYPVKKRLFAMGEEGGAACSF